MKRRALLSTLVIFLLSVSVTPQAYAQNEEWVTLPTVNEANGVLLPLLNQYQNTGALPPAAEAKKKRPSAWTLLARAIRAGQSDQAKKILDKLKGALTKTTARYDKVYEKMIVRRDKLSTMGLNVATLNTLLATSQTKLASTKAQITSTYDILNQLITNPPKNANGKPIRADILKTVREERDKMKKSNNETKRAFNDVVKEIKNLSRQKPTATPTP